MVLLVNGFGLGLNGFHRSTDQFLFRRILLHLAFGLAPGLFLCWANPADAFLKKKQRKKSKNMCDYTDYETVFDMACNASCHYVSRCSCCYTYYTFLQPKKYLEKKLV